MTLHPAGSIRVGENVEIRPGSGSPCAGLTGRVSGVDDPRSSFAMVRVDCGGGVHDTVHWQSLRYPSPGAESEPTPRQKRGT
jgi:hypothetical protein